MTTKVHSTTQEEQKAARTLRRNLRERRSKRRARKEARELSSKKTGVSESVSKAVKAMKVQITFDDLDDYQLEAYYGIHSWWGTQKRIGGVAKPLIIAGYAGCGKSALLSVALPALQNPDHSSVEVRYAAYTGKAANVLMTKGLASQTIHSLIYDCEPVLDEDGKPIPHLFQFVLKKREDISAELIVIDEASMVPDTMKADLESLGIPILYTGDHGQLPPVEGRGNVMDNPDFKLEVPHRQALNSGIIKFATDIREKRGVKKGVYGINQDAVVLPKKFATDVNLLASADAVICYTNEKRSELNARIREYKGFTGNYPEVGEKLICVKNNKTTQMVNGLIVEVLSIRSEGSLLIMDIVDESGRIFTDIHAFNNYFIGEDHPKLHGATLNNMFEFAYAITGHKSQGSQWDHVIVMEESMYGQTLDIVRRWKYTVVTRAVKKLTYITRFN